MCKKIILFSSLTAVILLGFPSCTDGNQYNDDHQAAVKTPGLKISSRSGWSPCKLNTSVCVKPRGRQPLNALEVEAIVADVAARNHIDPNAFLLMAKIESGLNPNAYHLKSHASGLFQFIPSTARAFGLLDPFDPKSNSEAAARLWRSNAQLLSRALRRNPTPGELYLAHQQGSRGAISLLLNPDKLAISIVGRRAVLMNRGDVRMTAKQFSDLWIKKFEVLD